MATSFTVNKADLEYILKQIQIAEKHASGTSLVQAIQEAYGISATDAALLPAGLRTVDGQDNNLLAGQAEFGAADNPFPRLTDPVFRNDADGDTMPFGPPGAPVATNTDYGVIGTPTNPNAPGGNGGHSGNVADADPRIISNLIVDMSVNNPAAIAAWFANPISVEAWHERNPGKNPVAPGQATNIDDVELTNADLAEIPNQSPDIGLSPGFNAFMTFFGQFFDHGLDLVTKGNNGTVFIPLQPDDPLYVPGGSANFMVLTRAAPTLDANGVPQHTNTTTSFVDQNQTYTSHSSHQVFLREYAKVDVPGDGLGAVAVSTGRLLDGNTANGSFNGAIANWGEVKAQALEMLGIQLQDSDVVNVPLLKTDQYGNFIPGPNGYAQLVMAPDASHTTTWFKEGTPAGITTDGALKTGHAFLDDIAHAANPVNSQTGAFKTADGNTTVGLSSPIALSNDSFEADSMATGSPGVIEDAVRGNYALIDPQGWDVTGFGGVFAPTAATIASTGHSGGSVVFLDNAATLVRDTGISLAQGSVYQMTFNVGDRVDTGFGGGTARLVTTDGIVLATVALPTPADGQWAPVTLSTGAVSAANAGKELRIEFIHGGSGQVLIDDIQLGSVAANIFDNELLDKHFITGDGRGNENIGLTAVHTIFHSEHNRLVDANKATILSSGDRAFINEWLLVDLGANDPIPTDPAGLVWDGERLFQAARFVTEMQYQHLVFEEFARRIQPNVDPFIFTNTADVDPSIVAEFAHVVYRFGHSMLTGTVDRLENDLTTVNGEDDQMTLIEAFLNPQGFIDSGANLEEATANLIRGMTRDVGNEMDEFIVSDVRSNLLGLPLDLGALNIARGRDTGVPSLNETRHQLYEDFGLADLKPYTSWVDFAQHLKHPASIVNFIAAYGTHPELLASDVNTLVEKRAVALALVTGTSAIINAGGVGGAERVFTPNTADRLDFLNGRGAYLGTVNPSNPNDLGGLGGLNDVDLWIGGLAEELNEFGGMLGSTFNFVFEYQMEHLQNGDRLYYLSRTQGLNLLNQLEPNSITDLVMRNTNLGHTNSTHLNGALFTTPDMILELDPNIRQENYGTGSDPNPADRSLLDPIHDDPFLQALDPKVYRVAPGGDVDGDGQADGGVLKFSGGEHVVLGGTEGNDKLLGDKGIDTLWGDGGNDYLNAGMESDDVFGGEGDDIIEDPFGDDVLRGNQGNDVISAGTGLDLIFGDQGKDFIIVGQDDKEAFGGDGDDFILGGTGKDFLLGGEGDDWIEGGEGFDTIAGENSELFFNSPIVGHDVLWGQGNDQDYDSESGDDIMLSGPGIQRFEGMFGFDWGIAKFDPLGANYDFQIPIFTTIPADILRDRFDQVEAASGWIHDDILRGDDRGHSGGSSSPDSTPVELFVDHTLDAAGVQRIKGLNDLLNGASNTVITSFKNGNILLGGDGNDLIQGRGGFDVIDGDAWLNVRIAITETKNGGAVVGTAESLTSQVFAVDANGNATTTVLHGGRPLNALMLDGTLNPGQMQIVREIKYDATPSDNVDIAFFHGGHLEYEIEGSTIQYNADGLATGRTGVIRDANNDGFITVRDLDDGTVAAPGRAGGLTVSRGALTDDTDKLVNIERLQFADTTLEVGSGSSNSIATGTVTIQDPSMFGTFVSPIVGQVLTAKLESFLDPDGIPIDPATGMPVGLTFEWQTTEAGNDGGWATISTGLTYTVRPVDPAHVLRAVAVFKDSKGVTERIASVGTDNVTAPFSLNENSPTGTVVAETIPFSVDYDPLGLGGSGVTDGDIVQLTHVMSPGQDAGGRFAIVNGQIVVANGGPVTLNYEAGVHTPANQSHQFVDNQYQIVIDTYTDTIQNGGVLMASRQFTILLNDVNEGVIVNVAPTLDLHADATTTTTGSYADNFNNSALNNSTGATPWTSPWVEIGDNSGTNSPSAGQIRVDDGLLGQNVLQFRDDDNDTGNGTATIQRTLNLAGVTSATVSYSYDENSFDAGETVTVTFAADGVNFNQTIQTITGASGSGNIANFALTGPFTANAAIRFVVSGTNNNSFSTDRVSIDNLTIATSTTTFVPGTPGNSYTATYNEDGAAVAIASNPAITNDHATILSATIKLTNAQASDVLSIAGTLPAGITSSLGPAIAGEVTMYLTGNASLAAYQTAIQAVRFSHSGGNPNPTAAATPRTIEVAVNDGISSSTIATATVNVVSSNDLPVAGDDRIVTNITTAPFTIPEWAFLANDVDLDGVLDITATSTTPTSSLTAALNTGSITITDIGPAAGGTFNYVASDGAGSDTASVALVRDTTGAIDGGTGNDILVGDGGNSTLNGNDGNDIIFAGAGNDTLNGGNGADNMMGGAGNDTYIVNDAGDVVNETDAGSNGTDQVNASISYTLRTDVENLSLTGGDAVNGTGNALANVINGNSGANQLFGGAGNDTIDGGDGSDLVDGGTGNDTLSGGNGNDTDTIIGGEGNDTIDVGSGNDIIRYSANGFGNDTINNFDSSGGTGNQDLIDLSAFGLTAADVGATVASRVQIQEIEDGATDDTLITIRDAAGAVMGTIRLEEVDNAPTANVTASDFIFASVPPLGGATNGADTLPGTAGNDTMAGMQGNDTINALAGDDTITWNANAADPADGMDIVNGGTEGTAGDTFVLNGRAAASETFRIYTVAAWVAAGNSAAGLVAGTEIVITRDGTNLASMIAQLSEIEEIRINGFDPAANATLGGDAIQIIGDFSSTSLRLNTITIEGDAGDDTIDISALTSAHRIVFKSNGGNDTIVGTLRPQDVIELPEGATAADYQTTIDANGVTTMTRDGHTITFVREAEDDSGHDNDTPDTGGTQQPSAARTVVGTAAADALLGTASDDIILGGASGDILVGDDGNDILRGEDGNDVITAGNGEDSVTGGEGDDELHGGAGSDMLFGGAGKDLIHGEAGDDFIEDGTGDDQVWGGTGNDTVIATANDGSDHYWGGDGADTLDYSAASGNLSVDLGNGFMQRGQVSGGNTGSDIVQGFENFVGGSGHDVVTATVGVNIMDGGAGNDTFCFNSVAAADGDRIYGFQPGDKINFSSIDANSTAAGTQGFVLSAGTALTAAGQIVVTHEVQDGEQVTVIHGNVDANTDADFELTLVGKHNLTASDFQGVS